MILATTHTTTTDSIDTRLMLDIDLTILGAAPTNYTNFESAIRQEYSWVPYFLYRKKRIAILQHFLDRPSIYQHPYFHNQYEQQARQNLTQAIAQLK